MSSPAGRALIYGGKGALGSACVKHFKANNFWVGSVDFQENGEADSNVIVPKDVTTAEQEKKITEDLKKVLADNKLDAVICVAGGWAGGNATKDLINVAELTWKQSVCSSLIATSIAASFLKEGGLITLTGAAPALEGTPGMIGYGMAKAAVHQLTKSLAGENSGLPKNSTAVAILPVTLDTPMNRKWMPKADHSTWTSLEFIGELFLKWTTGKDRPANGSLLKLITKDSKTEVIPA